jgi:microcystin-dependent protein
MSLSKPFISEIRVVGFGYPPRGWVLYDGAVLQISNNTTVFSILGTTYGGDERITFALPALRDRAPLNGGQGPGLSTLTLQMKES